MFKSRVFSMFVRLLVVMTASVAACLVGTSAAQATIPDPPGGSCSWNCLANEIVFLDPTVKGTDYYFEVKAVPKWAEHYNWGFDGCSVPQWVIDTLNDIRYPAGWGVTINPHLGNYVQTYARFFRPSCRIHDFGYRNFGKGPYTVTAGDSSDQRKSVDDRFHTLMGRRCGHNPPSIPLVPDDWACNRAADVFYQAVRIFGGSHW